MPGEVVNLTHPAAVGGDQLIKANNGARKYRRYLIGACAMQVIILTASLVITILRALYSPNTDTDLAQRGTDPIWQGFLYFTNQSNVLALVALILDAGMLRRLRTRVNGEIFRILAASWITLTMIVYGGLLFPGAIIDPQQSTDYDPAQWIIVVWLHLFYPLVVIIHFVKFPKQFDDYGLFRYRKILPLQLGYVVGYLIVVVVFVQWLTPMHWSVYKSTTMWYHWIDPAVQVEQIGTESNPQPWMILLAVGVSAIVDLLYIGINNTRSIRYHKLLPSELYYDRYLFNFKWQERRRVARRQAKATGSAGPN